MKIKVKSEAMEASLVKRYGIEPVSFEEERGQGEEAWMDYGPEVVAVRVNITYYPEDKEEEEEEFIQVDSNLYGYQRTNSGKRDGRQKSASQITGHSLFPEYRHLADLFIGKALEEFYELFPQYRGVEVGCFGSDLDTGDLELEEAK